MSDEDYIPPKVWTWSGENGGEFAAINRPIAGATHEHALPVGKHPFQLYSLATPNGVKTAYDLAALAMPKAGGTFSGQVLFNENASLVFEGSSPDNFETTLAVADPTADHTVTLPNLSGTVALTSQLDDGTFD